VTIKGPHCQCMTSRRPRNDWLARLDALCGSSVDLNSSNSIGSGPLCFAQLEHIFGNAEALQRCCAAQSYPTAVGHPRPYESSRWSSTRYKHASLLYTAYGQDLYPSRCCRTQCRPVAHQQRCNSRTIHLGNVQHCNAHCDGYTIAQPVIF